MHELLVDYCAGELGPDERAPFEMHLGRCADCLVYLRGYRATIRLVQDSNRGAVVAAAPDDLVRSILERCARRSDRRKEKPTLLAAPAGKRKARHVA